MDESTLQSASKVHADPANPSNKEGRREAEDVVKESVNAKKQKVEEMVAEIKEGEEIVKRQVKTPLEDDCSLESERQIEVKTRSVKNDNLGVTLEDERTALEEDNSPPKKTIAIVGNNGDVALYKTDETGGSSCSSLEDVASIKEDVVATRKSLSAPINPVLLTTTKKQKESGGDLEYEEQSSSEDVIGDLKQFPAFAIEKGPVAVNHEKDKSSSNHSDSEGKTCFDVDVCEVEKASTSSKENVPITVAMTKAVSSCDLEHVAGDNEEPQEKETITLLYGTPDVLKSSSQAAQQDSISAHGKSDDDYVSSRGHEPKKNTDVEMTDLPETKENAEEGGSLVEKTTEAPSIHKDQVMGSKTVFVGNLSFSVWQEDVEKFFQAAGEIAGIRFAMNPDETFRGHGYVEFTSVEAAEKAVRELNGKELLRRRVRLDLARGRQLQMSGGSEKDGKAQGQTIFVRGFKDDDAEQIRGSLEHHFGSCGEIIKVCVPKDQDGGSKGVAYIDFKDTDTCSRALELSGSDFRGNALSVMVARPKVDHRDGVGGGRWGGRSGWGFGGRFGGGRDFGSAYGRGQEFGGRVGNGREFGGTYGSGRKFGGRYGGIQEFGSRYGGSQEFGGRYSGDWANGDRHGGDREFGGRYSGDWGNGSRHGSDAEFGGRYSGDWGNGSRYGGDWGNGGRYNGGREFGDRYGGDREFRGRFYGNRQFGGGRGFGGSRGRGFGGRGHGTLSEPTVHATGTWMNTTTKDTE